MPAHGNDSWTRADKRAHFLGGLAISGAVACLHRVGHRRLAEQLAASLPRGELIDAAKSGWKSHHVSAKDFAAGCLGGVAGAFAGVYIAPNRIVWSRQF